MIDTHCHLNLPEYFPDVASEVEFARSQGVEALVVVGTDLETSQSAVAITERFEDVFAIVGWHPTSTARYSSDSLVDIERMLAHPKVVAIGEIGLDFYWDHATVAQQMSALRDQLDLARSVGAPIVFHCREAYSELLDLLEREPVQPYLLHCFAGNAEHARRAVALGCYFGVDGPISYKKADELRAVVDNLPRDRIVIETDAPFLTPEPFRGKRNRPGHVVHVNAALAKCLGVTADDCRALTTTNARRFFPKLLTGSGASGRERHG